MFSPKWNISTGLPRFREHRERGGRKNLRAGGWEGGCKTSSCGHDLSIALRNPQQLWVPEQDHASKNSSVQQAVLTRLSEEKQRGEDAKIRSGVGWGLLTGGGEA